LAGRLWGLEVYGSGLEEKKMGGVAAKWFECRSALLVERKMQFQSTMKEGLDHGPDCNTIILKKNAH
jgi:hypothetical protein